MRPQQEPQPDLAPIADTLHTATNHTSPSMIVQLTGSMPGRDVRQEGQATWQLPLFVLRCIVAETYTALRAREAPTYSRPISSISTSGIIFASTIRHPRAEREHIPALSHREQILPSQSKRVTPGKNTVPHSSPLAE